MHINFLYDVSLMHGDYLFAKVMFLSLPRLMVEYFLPIFHEAMKWSVNHSVMSDSLWPNGLQPTVLLCPWNSPGEHTGVCCHFLLQGIFPTQEFNQVLLYCRQMLYHLSHQGCPFMEVGLDIHDFHWLKKCEHQWLCITVCWWIP